MASTTYASGVVTPVRATILRFVFPASVAVILSIALTLRLLNLTNPPGFDEGKYSQGLMNMSRGFRPFADIFNPQGPLFYPSLYPFFKMGGETLEAARVGSVFWSMLGLGATGTAGWLLAGRAGALIALVLLCVSPQYLAQGRVIQSEASALGFALPAAALALAAYRSLEQHGRHGFTYLALAAAALGLSFAVKALTLGTAALIALVLLLAPDKSLRWRLVSAALCATVGTLVILAVALPFNLARVWEQGVAYHATLKALQPPELDVNVWRVVRETMPEGWGLILLAALGGLIWLKYEWRLAVILLGWTGATLIVLVTHSPLLNHHVVVLVPTLVLLATGLAWARRAFPRGANTLMAVGVIGYCASLPIPLEPVRDTVERHAPHQLVIDAATQIAAVLGPDEFVVTDHPYAATLARRATPPELADADKYRFESGWITSADLIRISQARDVKAALLWLGIYDRSAPDYVSWLQDHFFPLWSSEQPGQVLYVRRDVGSIDVSQLPGYQPTPYSSFGSELELLAYSYPGQALPGSNIDVRMIWRATSTPSGVYRVVGVVVNEQDESIADASVVEQWRVGVAIGEPGQTTERWSSGDIGGARLRIPIPAGAALGRNRLFIGLQRPDGALAATSALEGDGKPRRSWNGMMFLSDLNLIARG